MKRNRGTIKPLLLIGFLTAIMQLPLYADQNYTAREIIEKADQVNRTDDSIYTLTMEIRRGSSTRVREMKMWMKSDDQGNDRSLIRFTYPSAVKGTGFLTIEHSDREDDQWLYLPVLKRVRRIASSKKGGSFMGSDLSYADMSAGDIDNYSYRVIGSEVLEGGDCYVIEEIPLSDQIRKDEGYSKKISWIRKDIFSPLQVQYYDKQGNYSKVMRFSGFQELKEAGVWIATRIVMTDEQKEGNETVITYDEIEVNTGISDGFFTQRYLSREN